MVHCALLITSAQTNRSTRGRDDNGKHLDRGREMAGTLQLHFPHEMASIAH
jgi:hypothetical protein